MALKATRGEAFSMNVHLLLLELDWHQWFNIGEEDGIVSYGSMTKKPNL